MVLACLSFTQRWLHHEDHDRYKLLLAATAGTNDPTNPNNPNNPNDPTNPGLPAIALTLRSLSLSLTQDLFLSYKLHTAQGGVEGPRVARRVVLERGDGQCRVLVNEEEYVPSSLTQESREYSQNIPQTHTQTQTQVQDLRLHY